MERVIVNPTRQLHELGQRLWLDNITRVMLDNGGLRRYMDEFSITGLTSNPSIFDAAIAGGDSYDAGIGAKARAGKSGEALFMELALEDLCRAADLFRPVFDSSDQADGWVSMEVSPLLAEDTEGTIEAARQIHRGADRPNLLVKIPGTPQGNAAIEESIFAGVPVNVTLLFSREQYLASANAYLRGVERRIEAGQDPRVGSVASLFVSRWDVAVKDQVPGELRNKLGIAMAGRTYVAYRELLASPRWLNLARAGARPQRLLWASTGTKDPDAPGALYVQALAAPGTINTIPEKTLLAFDAEGRVGAAMATNPSEFEVTLARFQAAGVDIDALALKLQEEGAQAFVASWLHLLARIVEKSESMARF